MTGAGAELSGHLDLPTDLDAILSPLLRGTGDPAMRRHPGGGFWLTGWTPSGAFTALLRPGRRGANASFWGPGRAWGRDHLPDLLGADDDPAGFAPAHRLIEQQWRRYRNTWRVPRTLLTWQTAVVAVLEQRVTGRQAWRAWRMLLAEHGGPAPGPGPEGLRVVPDPDAVLAVPSWDWHRYGVDPRRVRTLQGLARNADLLLAAEDLPPAQGRERIRRLPGVGPWTAAEIGFRAWGDPDAVSIGDYHLGRTVTYALTGRLDGDDGEMLDLLSCYAGHRYRAIRMIELSGTGPPRRGPRMRLPGPQPSARGSGRVG